MKRGPGRTATGLVVGCLLLLTMGCGNWRNFYQTPSAMPLGSLSDPVWQNQEINAEYSDFVVYVHEFEPDGFRLNTDGEDHVKLIAARLQGVNGVNGGFGVNVVIERSRMTARENTMYKFPVHPNPELDMQRRAVVARALSSMGIVDAEERVIVAPALTPGLKSPEAEQAYRRTFGHTGGYGGGFGGGGGF